MARPRDFDTEAAVRAAMQVFWTHGYAGTAMSDIYAATGLKPGSVYAAFGDKAGLFRAAFEAYSADFRASLPPASGLAAIRAWLDTQVALATQDPDRRGCLIVNTAMERQAHTPDTQRLVQARLAEIRDFFIANLVRAMRDDDAPPDTDVPAQADALLGAVVAIMALGRAGADAAQIGHIAAAAVEGVTGGLRPFLTDRS